MSYTTTYIELKENSGQASNVAPGDFSIQLAKPILLTEGTQISLKSVFIDAESQSNGRIFIDADPQSVAVGNPTKTITISYVPYFKNHGNSFGKEFLTFDKNADYFDGRDYFLTDSLESGHGSDLDRISTLFLQSANNRPISKIYYKRDDGFGKISQFIFEFDYVDLSGAKQTFNFTLPLSLMEKKGWSFQPYDSGGSAFPLTFEPEDLTPYTNMFPLICKRGSFVPSLTKIPNPALDPNSKYYDYNDGATIIRSWGIDFLGDQTRQPVTSDKTVLTPRIYTSTFTIQGNKSYSPQDLADELTRAINTIQPQGGSIQAQNFQPCDNPMLQSTLALFKQGKIKNPVEQTDPGAATNQHPFFVDPSGTRILQFSQDYLPAGNNPIDPNQYNLADPNYYIGTPQFAILFDELSGAEGSFRIDSMHGSIIKSSAGGTGSGINIVKEVNTLSIKVPEGGIPCHFFAGRNSGIVITNLLPTDLWFGTMGFNQNTLLTQFPSKETATNTFSQFSEATTFTCPVLQNGINITTDTLGLDVIVNNSGNNFDIIQRPSADTVHKAFAPPNGPAFPGLDYLQREVAVTQRTPIVAINNFVGNQGAAPEGYYLVEISGSVIKSNIVTAGGYSSKIMGIVSRYYNSNSFTSSIDGEGSFSFVHKGEPELLTNLRVRILDPNRNLATGLDTTKNVLNQEIGKTTVFLQVDQPPEQ